MTNKLYTSFMLSDNIPIKIISITVLALFIFGCTNFKPLRNPNDVARDDALETINSVRTAENLDLLILNESLNKSAAARAEQISTQNIDEQEASPLKRLINSNIYARFAFSHAAKGNSPENAVRALMKDPLAVSKFGHAGINSIGIGFFKKRNTVHVVIDLARVIDSVDKKSVKKVLKEKIAIKRSLNSAPPLSYNDSLDEIAQNLSKDFMENKGSSDELIAKVLEKTSESNFSLGKITISFQVTNDSESAIIPARISDPSASFAGIGIAQGNHKEHDPGSLAVTIILARAQEQHEITRPKTDLPPPKAISLLSQQKKEKEKGTPIELAWKYTLTGNHKGAIKYFKIAYSKQKDPQILYELARSHARNGDNKNALITMKQYAELAEGEKRAQANEMIAKLSQNESIFSESTAMSTEAKRFFIMGQSLFGNEQWDGAIDAFQQAYAYAPHPDIIYNIGYAHLKAGRIGTALDFFSEYLRVVPKTQNIEQAKQLFMMGIELYQIGQYEVASKRFAMAYSFMPIPDILYNLALCYKAMGENKKARKFLGDFLTTGPSEKDQIEVRKLLKELKED